MAGVNGTKLTAGTESMGIYRDYSWECVLTKMGHRCGYVQIPFVHPLHGKDYDQVIPGVALPDDEPLGKRGIIPVMLRGDAEGIPVDVLFNVHGGITFADTRHERKGWWLGFDCIHSGDAPEPSMQDPQIAKIAPSLYTGVVRSKEYVEEELRDFIDQIITHFPNFTRTKDQWI